jgi:hypothetical protein
MTGPLDPSDPAKQADHPWALPWSQIQQMTPETDGKVEEKYKPSAHTAAVKAIIDGVSHLPGWKRVRKRQVGRFILTDANGHPRKQSGKWVYVYVAIKGDPDVELSWLPPELAALPIGSPCRRALSIAIEAKTGSGVLSTAQKEKKAHLEAGGWIYIVAGTGAEAVQECQRLARAVLA